MGELEAGVKRRGYSKRVGRVLHQESLKELAEASFRRSSHYEEKAISEWRDEAPRTSAPVASLAVGRIPPMLVAGEESGKEEESGESDL